MTGKRQYTKRSDYWDNRKKNSSASVLSELAEMSAPAQEAPVFVPELIGESLYSAASNATRTNRIATKTASDRFANIRSGLLPCEYSSDYVDARDAIELVQRAYFNIASVKSTIDMLSEFADSELFLTGGTEKSKKFVQAWWNRINIKALKAMVFREFYRSGNVMLYRLDGKISSEKSTKILESYGASGRKTKIPIRYIVLNPADIAVRGGVTFADHSYFKMLTPYEIARLKNPQTVHEREILESLPDEVKKQIRSGGATKKVYMPLDASFLHAFFAKKQDYEPLAVPMCFPVMDDINKKLELKKIDQAIARSIENVVLLVTMGAEPDKGGINQANVNAMRELFKNKSVGRVLVADYTTKADFIIPDLKKVIGPEKYQVLNKDIEEGLQNVLIGESKYSDTQLKMQIFTQRLEEARNQFLNEFMQPEIKRLCKAVGLTKPPIAQFKKTDLLNNAELQKMTIRLIELGVLTPEQGMQTINSGEFPDSESLDDAQERFVKDREDGKYLPLVNSINLWQAENMPAPTAPVAGKPAKKKQEGPAMKPTTASPSGGRPTGESNAHFSRKEIIECVKEMNEFELQALKAFGEKFGADSMTKDAENNVSELCGSIFSCHEKEKWNEALTAALDNLDVILDWQTNDELLSVAAEHQLDDRSAAILWHSKKNRVND